MDGKDVDIPPDVEELFPEQICLAHYVEAWKFIVTFKKERGQRQWRRDKNTYFICLLYLLWFNPSDTIYNYSLDKSCICT